MSLNSPPRPQAPDAGTTQPADAMIWVHPAFCSMALPVRAARTAWQRDIGSAAIRIEAALPEETGPSGRILRLGLMHVGDAAFRANNPGVELAEDAAQLAAVLGIDPKTRDLAEQWRRLQAARILVSWAGGPEIGVFDARSRPRAGGPEFRPGVRLNSKFLASLAENGVPLERRIVGALSASPAALDAYAWIRLSLQRAAADDIITTPWDDLLRRFGTPSQDMDSFKVAFEAALRQVFDVDPSIALAVDEDGVSLRHASPEDEEAPGADASAAAPAVVEAPAAQPAAAAPVVAAPVPPAPVAAAPVVAAPVAPAPVVAAPEAPVAQASHRRDRAQPPRPPEGPVAAADDVIEQDSISLPRHLTGLTQVIWLRRGHGEDSILVGVTPSPRFEPARLTVLAVEPMVIQVSGGLPQPEFERVSAWVMVNRDLIDEFWEGRITSFAEVNRRVRKAPAPGWR